MNELTTGFTTNGIMTDEVGTITGDVELKSECDDAGDAHATVRYKDADEWYTVPDAREKLASAVDLPIYHTKLVGKYNQQA